MSCERCDLLRARIEGLEAELRIVTAREHKELAHSAELEHRTARCGFMDGTRRIGAEGQLHWCVCNLPSGHPGHEHVMLGLSNVEVSHLAHCKNGCSWCAPIRSMAKP